MSCENIEFLVNDAKRCFARRSHKSLASSVVNLTVNETSTEARKIHQPDEAVLFFRKTDRD